VEQQDRSGSLTTALETGQACRFAAPDQCCFNRTGTVEAEADTDTTQSKRDTMNTSLRIMVAEDSPDNQLLVRACLKGTSHCLTFVGDGEAAVEQFHTGRFDLILMDIRMPTMDGLAATRTIRLTEQERGLAPMPIISLTANARPEDIKSSQEAGCDAHLSKPISRQKLLAAINQYGPRAWLARLSKDGDAGTIQVQIPEGFEDLAPEYLAARRDELAEMMHLLAASDFERLRTLGHNMKGSGASYGFLDLSRIGGLLEEFAKAGDREAFRANLGELGDYLAKVRLYGNRNSEVTHLA
jgi:CheY-like chemotaxis protein